MSKSYLNQILKINRKVVFDQKHDTLVFLWQNVLIMNSYILASNITLVQNTFAVCSLPTLISQFLTYLGRWTVYISLHYMNSNMLLFKITFGGECTNAFGWSMTSTEVVCTPVRPNWGSNPWPLDHDCISCP